MTQSPLWLAQIQFLAGLGFMSLFMVLELGLAWVLLYFKLRARRVQDQARYTAAYRLWVRVFALTVVLVLASGAPMLLQLGVLWPDLLARIGNVSGPLLAAALLSTFVFKSCFLGVMLFGQRRVSDTAHTVVVLMVALGVTFSLFWILVLQSWMQAPAGATFVDDIYQVSQWDDVVFNPFLGSFAALAVALSATAVGFLFMGHVCRHALRHTPDESTRSVFRTGLALALGGGVLLLGALLYYGHQVALYQPAKAAATAAYWQTGTRPDLALVGWPSEHQNQTIADLNIRDAARPWLARDERGVSVGLDKFAGMHAPVALTFWAWRLLFGFTLALTLLCVVSALYLRKKGYDPTALSAGWQRLLAVLTYSGWGLMLLVLVHVWLGQLPFAVFGTITVADVLGEYSTDLLFGALVVAIVVYVLLVAAFVRMVGHSMRYGVVPVARRRGRA